jgi:hypothetical protein
MQHVLMNGQLGHWFAEIVTLSKNPWGAQKSRRLVPLGWGPAAGARGTGNPSGEIQPGPPGVWIGHIAGRGGEPWAGGNSASSSRTPRKASSTVIASIEPSPNSPLEITRWNGL